MPQLTVSSGESIIGSSSTAEVPFSGTSTANDDPLNNGGDLTTPRSSSYLRGFFDAEKRRQEVNTIDELPFASVFFRYTVAMAPIALLWIGSLWLAGRMRYPNPGTAKRMMANTSGKKFSGGGEQEESFGSELRKVMQNAMTPLTPRDFRVNVKDTRFKDVIGIPEAVKQVEQYVQFLQEPYKFTRLGARMPKGCLLTGPPGTGKTLLAKAVAGEAHVPFFSCNGADFMELYVGSGPKRVRELFEAARAAAPSVVFIDELDAVGARDGQASGTSISSEENRTINQLLAELDGLRAAENVVVFAATNFKENIDKALLRDGRFDRKVEVDLPDKVGREALFLHYLKKIKLDSTETEVTSSDAVNSQGSSSRSLATPERADIAIARKMALLTPGASPATVSTIVNEAAIQAAVKGLSTVSKECLLPAIDDVLLGKKQSSRSRASESASRRTAWHESGHALIAWLLQPLQTEVLKVSITPRNLHHHLGAGDGAVVAGYTQQLGREALEMKTELTIFSDVCVMLGGRFGEVVMHKMDAHEGLTATFDSLSMESASKAEKNDIFQSVSTGAQDDYQRATKLALESFLSFGMSPLSAGRMSSFAEQLGLLSYEPERIEQGRIYQKHSSFAQSLAEEEAALFLEATSRFVFHLLIVNSGTLQKLAEELFVRKELMQEDLVKIIGDPASSFTVTDFLRSKSEAQVTEGVENRMLSHDHLTQSNTEAIKRVRDALEVFFKTSEEAAIKRNLSRKELFS